MKSSSADTRATAAAGALLTACSAGCLESDPPRVVNLTHVCLSEWWVHTQASCAAEQHCPGALLVRTLALDGTRVDVPIDLSPDGSFHPRFEQARLVPFKLSGPNQSEGGVFVAADGERQTYRCHEWTLPPFVNGERAKALPKELRAPLHDWNRERLNKAGLDAMGQPLPKSPPPAAR